MVRLLNRKDRKQFNKLIKIAASEKRMFIKKRNTFFGYFVDKKLVGIVGFNVVNSENVIKFVHGYVLPEYRNNGYYNELTNYRLEYCKEYYKNYTVYVTANNNSKHQLEKLGFTLVEPQYKMKLDF